MKLAQLSLHVEAERAAPVISPTRRGIEVLKSYVLLARKDQFSLIRTDDLLWVYQHTTTATRRSSRPAGPNPAERARLLETIKLRHAAG